MFIVRERIGQRLTRRCRLSRQSFDDDWRSGRRSQLHRQLQHRVGAVHVDVDLARHARQPLPVGLLYMRDQHAHVQVTTVSIGQREHVRRGVEHGSMIRLQADTVRTIGQTTASPTSRPSSATYRIPSVTRRPTLVSALAMQYLLESVPLRANSSSDVDGEDIGR